LRFPLPLLLTTPSIQFLTDIGSALQSPKESEGEGRERERAKREQEKERKRDGHRAMSQQWNVCVRYQENQAQRPEGPEVDVRARGHGKENGQGVRDLTTAGEKKGK
jgi:hypothetical protein